MFQRILFACVLLSFAVGVAQQSDNSGAMSAAFRDLKWQPILPELGADSPQIAILRVDPKTKATQLYVRTPKNMHVALHWHSSNETHTVVQGRAAFAHSGQREELGVGGFNFIPAKMQHEAWTSDDCLLFITVDAGWDVNWVNGAPGKSDLGHGLRK